MAIFRIKDLMIKVMPSRRGGVTELQCEPWSCGDLDSGCGDSCLVTCGCSDGGCSQHSNCGGDCSDCSYCTAHCSGCTCSNTKYGRTSIKQDLSRMGLSTLAALREQLHEALQAIEQRQREIETQLRPKTLADVENLERKITESLEDLRSLKAELLAKEADNGKK